jgi:type I restriction enzyme M protein
MLKPGGRAAIVLPQGKFNNSSLAFIREWILRKARLLAVVGLHGNSFKPHTGTKTSVLFIQKYTDKELANILKIQNEVKAACPDYKQQIETLLKKYQDVMDLPDEEIPENILELMLETFAETESEVLDEKGSTENSEASASEASEQEPDSEEQFEIAQERIHELKSQLVKIKTKLNGMDDLWEAMLLKQKTELEILKNQKAEKAQVNQVLEEHKSQAKVLKEQLKTDTRTLKSELKQLEKEIPQAEYDFKMLTTKGKLQLILEDEELLQKLSDRFIDAEVARRLDYAIFMAVSEHGGKDNSGEYEYKMTPDGNLVEDMDGNPVYKQDLVNYAITKEQLLGFDPAQEALGMAAENTEIYGEPSFIAEAFVKFAKEEGFSFWRE